MSTLPPTPAVPPLVQTAWWLARPIMSRTDLVDYLTTLVWNGASTAGLGQITVGKPS